jgi:hypothetical protein
MSFVLVRLIEKRYGSGTYLFLVVKNGEIRSKKFNKLHPISIRATRNKINSISVINFFTSICPHLERQKLLAVERGNDPVLGHSRYIQQIAGLSKAEILGSAFRLSWYSAVTAFSIGTEM